MIFEGRVSSNPVLKGLVYYAWIQRENNRKRTEKEKDFITFSLHIDKGCYKLCCYLYQKFFNQYYPGFTRHEYHALL